MDLPKITPIISKINKDDLELNSDNSLDTEVGLEAIPIFNFLYSVSAILLSLWLYIMEGRYAGYLPTASETGTEYPNHATFGHATSTASIATLYTMIIAVAFIRLTEMNTERNMKLFQILTCTTVIGQIGVALSPLNEVRYFHYFFASLGFLSMMTFEIRTYFVIKNQTTAKRIIRGLILLQEFIGLFVFLFAEWIWNDRVNVTYSAYGEHATFLAIHLYFVTFCDEMHSLKIVITNF